MHLCTFLATLVSTGGGYYSQQQTLNSNVWTKYTLMWLVLSFRIRHLVSVWLSNVTYDLNNLVLIRKSSFNVLRFTLKIIVNLSSQPIAVHVLLIIPHTSF